MANRRRTVLPILVLLVCFSGVAFRLFFIQIWSHEELRRRVDRLIMRERPEMPCRGMILDSGGKMLSMSVKTYTLFADGTQIKDRARVAQELGKFSIALPPELTAGPAAPSYVIVAKELDGDTMQQIKTLKIPGLGFQSNYQRQYPEGRMACHVLGVVGKDGSGLEGVELAENAYLSGAKVRERKYRDGSGREISEKLIDPDRLRGADVYLTIDRNLQFIAEQEIGRAWKETRSKKAMAIIQDPNTGDILAMASYPDFDPADYSGAALKNPVVSDIFEPGSTFKLVTAAAALSEKAVNPSEAIWCEDGMYTVFGHTISDHEKKGFLNLAGIIQYSSNIGTAKVGQRVGKEKLYEYVRQFGFFSLSGIDLPGEARGLLRTPDQWSGLSLPVISFGQEVGVTALQVVNAYSAIANGGTLLEPRIVREVRSSSGECLQRPQRRVIRTVLQSGVAAKLREMLANVVEHGTGEMAKVPGYSAGGKTGTAQKRDPNTGRYSTSKYVASFCGMLPMSKPRLTIFVVLDEPQGDYYAASRAAPVFSRIGLRAVHYLQIPPDRNDTIVVCSTRKYARAPKDHQR